MHAVRYRFKVVWNWLFPRVPLPVHLPYGGWWLATNSISGDSVFAGNFEIPERKFLKRFLKRGMTVVDAGAHHGFFTVLAAKKVGATGKVIAFEPSDRERKWLLLHLRLNRVLGRVTVSPMALGKTIGKAKFFVVERLDTGCNSLRQPVVDEPIQEISASVTCLDVFLSAMNIQRVDLIKMDVEGAELELLEGGNQLLSRQPRPIILAELADSRTKAWNYPASAIYDLLVCKGYRWYALSRDGTPFPQPRTDRFGDNFVAFPDERMSELDALS